MITRNIIINQLPEYKTTGAKSIRGILSLTGENLLLGTLKLYNVPQDVLPLTMAIKLGDKKFVYPNITEPEEYRFKVCNTDNTDEITILIASTLNRSVQGLAIGHNAGSNSSYADLFSEIEPEELDALIDGEIDKETKLESLSIVEDKGEADIKNIDNASFYSLIEPQLDELFSKFPHFKELEEVVQNTEWIKVNYTADNQNHYVIGKLYDGAEVTHLCYGIPAQSHSIAPPSSLIEFCQWIPLVLSEPEGAGYWIMYQNAQTGENVKL